MNVSPSLSPVLTAKANGVLTITLNRPDARNALSESVMRGLQIALDEAVEDRAVKVIVLAAKGPAFSAGHDLKELTARRSDPDRGLAYYRAIFAQCSHLMQTIVRHPRPVIAQVQGVATAAGCQLVASADLAVAADTARFATPGGKGGWFCITPMVAVQRVLTRKRALELLFTGDEIDAPTALAWGLVNRVVPADRVLDEAKSLARRASRGSTSAKALGKRLFYETVGLDVDDAYARAVPAMAESALEPDAREWMRAFLEKRTASYPPKR